MGELISTRLLASSESGSISERAFQGGEAPKAQKEVKTEWSRRWNPTFQMQVPTFVKTYCTARSVPFPLSRLQERVQEGGE